LAKTCVAAHFSSFCCVGKRNRATTTLFVKRTTKLPKTTGQTVFKNAYEKDLLAARRQAQTPEYERVRREHPAIERKLAELVRRHGAWHARYWGQARVLLQQLLTGWVVNIKRLVHLLVPPQADAQRLRAAVVETG
jgi:Transposase DDE domain